MTTFTPTQQLAFQRGNDVIWRIAQFSNPTITFPFASAIVDVGLAPPGGSVENTVTVYGLSQAWDRMLTLAVRAYDDNALQQYCDYLGVSKPEVNGHNESILLPLWQYNPQLASLVYNHMLIYRNIGLFRPLFDKRHEIEQLLLDNNFDALHNNFVLLPPSGLTQKELDQ